MQWSRLSLLYFFWLSQEHIFLQISEIFQSKKEKINEDTKELEEIVFPLYTSFVQQVESDAAKVKEDYKTLKQRIENQRTKWHNEIDKIVDLLQMKIKKWGIYKWKHWMSIYKR